jgi:hypothetical protein
VLKDFYLIHCNQCKKIIDSKKGFISITKKNRTINSRQKQLHRLCFGCWKKIATKECLVPDPMENVLDKRIKMIAEVIR